MKLSEFKLGEKVFVYILANKVVSRATAGAVLKPATIYAIGIPSTPDAPRYLGWRNGEWIPDNAGKRSPSPVEAPFFDYAVNHREYEWWFMTDGNCDVEDLVTIQTYKPESNTDSGDWRLFRNNQPGQCACGINISACIYHAK